MNAYVAVRGAEGGGVRIQVVRKAAGLVGRILSVFGLFFEDGADGGGGGADAGPTGPAAILDAFAKFRGLVRCNTAPYAPDIEAPPSSASFFRPEIARCTRGSLL